MHFTVLLLALIASCFADNLEHSADGKTRAHKPPQQNEISNNNGHQKPLNAKYESHQPQHQPPVTQATVYAIAPPQNYQPVDSYQQISHQPAFSFLPHQTVLHYPQHHVSVPKFQLIATKNAHGQMQLSLVPQSVFTSHVGYANVPQAVQQPLQNNHIQQEIQSVPVSVSPTPSVPYSTAANYVTPQPPANPPQPNSPPVAQAYYTHPLAGYNHLAAAQPYSNYVYTQQAPQAYANYLQSQPNHVYPASGHLLYHPKYQYVYNNVLPRGYLGNYQAPNPVDYEKYNYVQPPSQGVQKSDSGLSLNTNEYLAPNDAHFRPMVQRNGGYYKY